MAPALTLDVLREAIEKLRDELPALLGDEYPSFATQLDSSLDAGSVNRVLNLFGRHAEAHRRLLQALPARREDLTKGLFGDINVTLPYLYYVCPVGPHLLRLKRVEEHDAAGRPLCPLDHAVMKRISSPDLRAALEKLQPDLAQLAGTEDPDFLNKLKGSLADPSEDMTWTLLTQHDAVYQRVLNVLISG